MCFLKQDLKWTKGTGKSLLHCGGPAPNSLFWCFFEEAQQEETEPPKPNGEGSPGTSCKGRCQATYCTDSLLVSMVPTYTAIEREMITSHVLLPSHAAYVAHIPGSIAKCHSARSASTCRTLVYNHEHKQFLTAPWWANP